MNKPIIYLDFDGTLCSSTKRLAEILNDIYSTNVDWRHIKEYNCQDQFKTVTVDEIEAIFDREDFFHGLEVFENAFLVMKMYEDVFDWHIVTIGTSTNLRNKQRWCQENIPIKFVFHGVEQKGMGKSCVDMSDGIIIDDHIDNIRSSNARYKLLYRGGIPTEWNTQLPTETFIEVDGWNAIDYILNILGRKYNEENSNNY